MVHFKQTAIRPALWVCIFLLVPLALFACTDGFCSILNRPLYFKGGPWDLRRRWVEEECVREGKNPVAVMQGRLTPPAAGTPNDPDYPPWALTLGLIFSVHSWPATTVLFAFEDAIACFILSAWTYRIGAKHSGLAGSAIVVGVLAIGTNRVVLDVGQYTLQMCALLVLTLVLHQRGRHWLAGLALGLSLLKFSISLPFCLCFLVVFQWRTLLAAGGLTVAASLVCWKLIHTPPWVAFCQSMQVGETFSQSSPGFLKAMIAMHVPSSLAVVMTAAAAAAVGAALMWIRRRDSMLVQFAIACFTARLWTYHLWYDDSIMLFLLVAIAWRVIAPGPANARCWCAAAWIAVGLSLWLTLGFLYRWPVVALQCLIWTAGVASLLTFPVEREQGGPAVFPAVPR